MKYLPIFALFLVFACCEEKSYHLQCLGVEFSDALPIQFWLSDCETYNESVPQGVHYKCFCHPWKCDDELKIQFTDAFDSSEVVTSENIVAITLPALSTWLTRTTAPGLYDWTLGATPSVNLPGAGAFNPANSEYLYTSYSFTSGKTYSVTLNYTRVINSGSGNPRTSFLLITDAAFNTIFSQSTAANSGANVITITFVATDESSRIAFWHSSGSNSTITVTSTSGTRTDLVTTYPAADDFDLVVYNDESEEIERINFDSQLNAEGFFYTYNASLIPNQISPEICEQRIQFKVVNLSASPDQEVAKSDCIYISDNNPDPSVLIEYSNNRNFAGLIFENTSPAQTFNIRIPAVFFHQRFPEEDEVAELSTSIITLNGEMRAQRLLETPHMPYYMHRKIKLILKHQSVEVDGLAITKQDAYEIDEGDRRWPEKKAKCWLTERDFVQRNVV